MSHYFAYGSNLSTRQMASRCPGAIALGPGRLDGFALAFTRPSRRWGGSAADILREPRSHVWGVVWCVTDDDLAALDRFEGVATGGYRRFEVDVSLYRETVTAVTYAVVDPIPGGAPSGRYLHTILEGARQHGLPTDWIARLVAFRT